MTRIHNVLDDESGLQTESMGTKDHGHIHMYGTPIFVNIIVYI